MKTLSILIITALFTCMVVKSSEAHRYKKRNSNDLKKAQSDMINNYYTGPNCKEIKQQLSEIKQEIWSLRRVNITDELSSEMRQLLAEIKGDIRELKINLTSGSSLKGLFSEVKQQVAGLKEEVKLLRENLTGGPAGNGLLPEMKQLLAELKEEIMALKGNQTGSQGGTVPITSKPTPTHKPTLPSVPTTSRPIPTPKPTTVYPKNCAEIYKSGNWRNKVYKIDPDGLGEFDVFCDHVTAGGGWTVFQKRQDGSVDFFRGWDDYKRGFGNLNGEYWLGLDKIHRLTTSGSYKLRVDLEDNFGKKAYAEYRSFTVENETAKYQLSDVNNFRGTAGNSLSNHYGMAFTTKDRDNDRRSSHNCASQFKGAWWYNDCGWSNLNGLFRPGRVGGEGLHWFSWKKDNVSMRKSEMKLRPNDF